MIINYILQFLESIVLYVLAFLHFDLNSNVYAVFLNMVQYWNTAKITIPYLNMLQTGLVAVLLFELVLLAVKFFLGSRAPHVK